MRHLTGPSRRTTAIRAKYHDPCTTITHEAEKNVSKNKPGSAYGIWRTQGRPLSPCLFILFIDTYILLRNTAPSLSLTSCFANDSLVHTKDLATLQQNLQTSDTWAVDMSMRWNTSNSCGLQLPFPVKIQGGTLRNNEYDSYLGIALICRGVIDHKLLAERGIGYAAQNPPNNRRMEDHVLQRRVFVKSLCP